MEALTADEIYKTKLQEIREKYQAIRNETNSKEAEAIEKLNQSYFEIMCLLGQIEVKIAEMQSYKSCMGISAANKDDQEIFYK